ncbi:MAG: DUF6266 family protein [Marinifilaceae bacterium]
MALLSTPLGSIKNRLGNMVIYKNGDSMVVRAMPLRIRNPRSERQQEQRTRFKTAATLGGRLLPVIKHSFGATTSTAVSAFTGANMEAIRVNEEGNVTIDYARLLVSRGSLRVLHPEVVWDETEHCYVFNQLPPSYTLYGTDGDVRLYALLLDNERLGYRTVALHTVSCGGVTRVPLPEGYSREQIEIYTYGYDEGNGKSSDSRYREVV